jgi:protein SCO1/2
MIRRFAPWIAVALASLALLAAIGLRSQSGSASGSGGGVGVGGPFQLVDQTGKPTDQSVLKGKWSAVYFGYTYCPDFCPTTLTTLGGAIDRMGPRAKDFQVVFITVDPHRDTSAQLKNYLSSTEFPRGVIGLTGPDEAIAKVAKAYGVYYQKAGNGPSYSVDHSSAVYLMDPKGQFATVIPYGLTPDQAKDSIVRAMQDEAAHS